MIAERKLLAQIIRGISDRKLRLSFHCRNENFANQKTNGQALKGQKRPNIVAREAFSSRSERSFNFIRTRVQEISEIGQKCSYIQKDENSGKSHTHINS